MQMFEEDASSYSRFWAIELPDSFSRPRSRSVQTLILATPNFDYEILNTDVIYGFVNSRIALAFMVLETLTPPALQVTVDDFDRDRDGDGDGDCAASYLSAVRVSVLPARTEILYKENCTTVNYELMSDALAEALDEFRLHHNPIRGVGWAFNSNLGIDMFNILDSDFNVRQQKWTSNPKSLIMTTMNNYQISSITYH
jgi:hypothetical protein